MTRPVPVNGVDDARVVLRDHVLLPASALLLAAVLVAIVAIRGPSIALDPQDWRCTAQHDEWRRRDLGGAVVRTWTVRICDRWARR